jgi:hypothetical protein
MKVFQVFHIDAINPAHFNLLNVITALTASDDLRKAGVFNAWPAELFVVARWLLKKKLLNTKTRLNNE